MGFWGKAGKITGFVMLGTGIAGTAGFGALLGVGANAKYDLTKILGIPPGGIPPGGIPPGMPSSSRAGVPTPGYPIMNINTFEVGIGSLNYCEMYINGSKFDINTLPPAMQEVIKPELENKGSYSDFVKNARNEKNDPANKNNPLIQSMADEVIKAHDEMVSGAVLVTIFSLVTIISIPLLILNKKKA